MSGVYLFDFFPRLICDFEREVSLSSELDFNDFDDFDFDLP
jgi:hypothetical protein